jgi:hypothetical protein
MQDEEHHKNFGRGRNVSCNNFNCTNYRKKISRNRSGWYAHSTLCPVCHEAGYVHHYTCGVGKAGLMLCDCYLRSIGSQHISFIERCSQSNTKGGVTT